MVWVFGFSTNSYIETLIFNMMVFGSGAFGRYIGLGELISVFIRANSLSAMWEYSRKAAIYKLGKELQPDNQSAGTLFICLCF